MFSIFKKKPLTQEEIYIKNLSLVSHCYDFFILKHPSFNQIINSDEFKNLPLFDDRGAAYLFMKSHPKMIELLKLRDAKEKSAFLQRDETKWLIEAIVNALKESK